MSFVAGVLTVVEDQQKLRTLADVIYRQEVNNISSIKFQSEPELAQYLADCRASHDIVLGLLENAVNLKSMFQYGDRRVSVASDVYDYVARALNYALQTMRSYTLRAGYLEKLSQHVNTLIMTVQQSNPYDESEMQSLANDAAEYRNNMFEYLNKYRSPESSYFSLSLKQSGTSLDALVKSYQDKLGLRGTFEELIEKDKLRVYESIIVASGRGRIQLNVMERAYNSVGTATILYTAGMMVWDIYASSYPVQTAVVDAMVFAAGTGGAALGEIVGAAVATGLTGVEASSLFVAMAGVVGSVAGAVILAPFVGWLVAQIIGSGGHIPLGTDGLRCYVADMPDGSVLARQIAYQQW